MLNEKSVFVEKEMLKVNEIFFEQFWRGVSCSN